MKHYQIFKQVKLEFQDEELAMMVVLALQVNLCKPTRYDHVDGRNGGLYTKELHEEVRSALWESPKKKTDLTLKILNIMYEFQVSQDRTRTIKKLLREEEDKNESSSN